MTTTESNPADDFMLSRIEEARLALEERMAFLMTQTPDDSGIASAHCEWLGRASDELRHLERMRQHRLSRMKAS